MNETPNFTVVVDATAVHETSGGAGTYLRALVRHLPLVGIAPILLCRRNDFTAWEGASVIHRVAPVHPAHRLLWEQVRLCRTVERLVPNGPIVLHSPHYTCPISVPARIRRVVTIHDLTFFTRPNDHSRAKRLWFQRAIRQSATSADAIIAVSHATQALYTKQTGREDRVVVAQHGVAHEQFYPTTAINDIETDRQLLSSATVEQPYVLYLGTIEPRKQVPTLIDAFRRSDTDLGIGQLVLAGQQWPMMHKLLPAVAENERRLGYVSDDLKVALLRNANMVVYPSLEEGFGLPMLEALACGAPVVVADTPISREVCGNAATYFSADPSDDRGSALLLSDAMLEVDLGNAPTVEDRVAQASNFTWERSANAHRVAYVLASRRGITVP